MLYLMLCCLVLCYVLYYVIIKILWLWFRRYVFRISTRTFCGFPGKVIAIYISICNIDSITRSIIIVIIIIIYACVPLVDPPLPLNPRDHQRLA